MIHGLKHNWYRVLGTLVVCFCAIYTAWWKTHPADAVKVKTVIERVKQGDGLMSEQQCRSVSTDDKREELRAKYGFPGSDGNTDDTWFYPQRGKKNLYCAISFDYDRRVTRVTLDLVAA